jgi:hypothetical protein
VTLSTPSWPDEEGVASAPPWRILPALTSSMGKSVSGLTQGRMGAKSAQPRGQAGAVGVGRERQLGAVDGVHVPAGHQVEAPPGGHPPDVDSLGHEPCLVDAQLGGRRRA